MSDRGGRLVRYVVVGVVNTAITYALYLALLRAMPYALAYTIAFVAGIAVAYVLQARFVFGSPASWRTFLAFPLVYVVQYVVGVLALRLLVESGLASRELAAIAVLAVTVPIGFLLSRLVFARRRGS